MWSMVRLAMDEGRAGAAEALDELCRIYQRPVLAYIHRAGYAPGEAEDLKQEFFAGLLSRRSMAGAEATGSPLRAFLLTKLKSFLIDRHRYATARKRGGGRVVPLSDIDEEQRRMAEPVDRVTPDIAFQRQWMQTMAEGAMRRLHDEYSTSGQQELFRHISPFITNSSEETISSLSLRLGRPEGTLKSDIFRLRTKCQQLIREQVAATLENPTQENINAELKELMGCRQ